MQLVNLACGGQPPSPRSSATICKWQSDFLAVVGGTGLTTYLNDVHLLSLRDMSWSQQHIDPQSMASMPKPRGGACGAMLDEDHLVWHGGRGEVLYNSTFIYNFSTRRWSEVLISGGGASGGSLPPPREDGGCAAIDLHEFLVFGGTASDGSALNDMWLLNLRRRSWMTVSQVGVPPAGLAAMGTSVLEDRYSLLVFGGYDGSAFCNDLYRLDLKTFTWSRIQPLGAVIPRPRTHASVAVMEDGTVVVFGGYAGSTPIGDVWTCTLASSARVGRGYANNSSHHPPNSCRWRQPSIASSIISSEVFQRGAASCMVVQRSTPLARVNNEAMDRPFEAVIIFGGCNGSDFLSETLQLTLDQGSVPYDDQQRRYPPSSPSPSVYDNNQHPFTPVPNNDSAIAASPPPQEEEDITVHQHVSSPQISNRNGSAAQAAEAHHEMSELATAMDQLRLQLRNRRTGQQGGSGSAAGETAAGEVQKEEELVDHIGKRAESNHVKPSATPSAPSESLEHRNAQLEKENHELTHLVHELRERVLLLETQLQNAGVISRRGGGSGSSNERDFGDNPSTAPPLRSQRWL